MLTLPIVHSTCTPCTLRPLRSPTPNCLLPYPRHIHAVSPTHFPPCPHQPLHARTLSTHPHPTPTPSHPTPSLRTCNTPHNATQRHPVQAGLKRVQTLLPDALNRSLRAGLRWGGNLRSLVMYCAMVLRAGESAQALTVLHSIPEIHDDEKMLQVRGGSRAGEAPYVAPTPRHMQLLATTGCWPLCI